MNKIDAKTVSLYMEHSDVQTTLRMNGKLTEREKLKHLKREYAEILEMIDNFLK